MTQGQEAKPQMTIGERKRYVINKLTELFQKDAWNEKLLLIAGGDEGRIQRALHSFCANIASDDGGGPKANPQKFIADCSLSSLSAAFIEAFQMGIEVGGGRDHAHLIAYGAQCELEITYKGFVYALSQHFEDPFVIADVVMKDDEFSCAITDDTATYTHKVADSFDLSEANIKGAYCYFSYTQKDSKKKVSRIVRASKADIDTIRSKSRGSFAWKDFLIEMIKKSMLRRAAKIPFASIDFAEFEVNPEEVDNRHFLLEGNNASGSDRLKRLVERQTELLTDKEEGITPPPPTPDPASSPAPDPAPADTPPPADTVIDGEVLPPDQGDPQYQDISSADFEADSGAGDDKAATPPAAKVEWDRQTVQLLQGKKIEQQFATVEEAVQTLRDEMLKRKLPRDRKKLIDMNILLIAAAIRDGLGEVVEELHKLSDNGGDHA